MTKVLFIGLLSVMLAGCATSNMEQRAEDEAKASLLRAEAEKARRDKEQARLEGLIKQVPSWALEVPRPDETGVFAVGMAEADNLRVALRQATLEAEYGLAKTYTQELSGSERSFTQTNGGRTNSQQYTALIDKLVSQVPVSGFEVVRQEIKPIEGKYNAFVLLKLPFEQFNRTLQEQRSKQIANDKSIASAFEDLDKRLAKRRQQAIEDQRAVDEKVAAVVKGGRAGAEAGVTITSVPERVNINVQIPE